MATSGSSSAGVHRSSISSSRCMGPKAAETSEGGCGAPKGGKTQVWGSEDTLVDMAMRSDSAALESLESRVSSKL